MQSNNDRPTDLCRNGGAGKIIFFSNNLRLIENLQRIAVFSIRRKRRCLGIQKFALGLYIAQFLRELNAWIGQCGDIADQFELRKRHDF